MTLIIGVKQIKNTAKWFTYYCSKIEKIVNLCYLIGREATRLRSNMERMIANVSVRFHFCIDGNEEIKSAFTTTNIHPKNAKKGFVLYLWVEGEPFATSIFFSSYVPESREFFLILDDMYFGEAERARELLDALERDPRWSLSS
jgi:hypothetical protein